jgi:hypothetical protein
MLKSYAGDKHRINVISKSGVRSARINNSCERQFAGIAPNCKSCQTDIVEWTGKIKECIHICKKTEIFHYFYRV